VPSADTGAAAAAGAAPAPAVPAAGASGGSLAASRSFSAIMSGFEMAIPDLWGQRYMATERREPEEFPGARTVTEFVFLALSNPTPPPLLTLVRYTKGTYDGLPRKPGPVVASLGGGDVLAVQFPGANPFPAGSDDAQAFDSMRLSEAQVKRLVRVNAGA
jgi:hypothetical protein